MNNKLIKQSNFNELTLVNSKWQNEEGMSFNDLFFENHYYIGDLKFVSGDNTISIKAMTLVITKPKKLLHFM